MRYPEFHYRWEWDFEVSPDDLWPVVSDTNRFNRETGVPAVERLSEDATSLNNARQRLRLHRFGVPIEWEEEPFEWIRPSRFGVVRRYQTGPVAEMRVLGELEGQATGGTHLVYEVWARPRTPLGLVAIPLQIGFLSARRFRAAFHRYARSVATGASQLDMSTRPHLASGGHARLARLRDALLAQDASHELVDRLVATIERADDLTVTRLRPYALADAWGAPRRAVLELCLLATRVGLLQFRWDLLCPLCRGTKEIAQSLADVQPQVHCDVCRIDFTVNLDRFVELTFRPNPAVRPSDVDEYCVGGPQVTPHIVAQQLLQPGEERILTLPLEQGRYRIRTLMLPGGQLLDVTSNGVPGATLRAASEGWPHDEVRLTDRPRLRYENATENEQLFVLERMAWSDQATTAADVIALQRFRDLFAHEALRPGQQISVGSLAVLFTDLRGSTGLYRQIGDATAFGLVMNHFDVLSEAIAGEDGSIVKTIGDAVMAVFRHPMGALRAIVSAQKKLASPPEGTPPLLLKAGIHYGPCIAVNLNDRLDYFGSTVNIAARLEALSSGGDIVISATVRDDPEVAELLAAPGCSLNAEPMDVTLKGFEQERFAVWRVSASS